MFIAVNMLFKRLTYFSKRVGAVSLGWSSNSGKVGRLIAVAMVEVEVAEDCEDDEVVEESEDIKTQLTLRFSWTIQCLKHKIFVSDYGNPILVAICDVCSRY